MNKGLLVFAEFLLVKNCLGQQPIRKAQVTLSMLCIGNEYYDPISPFDSYHGFGASADSFFNCFKKQCLMPGIAKSSPEKPLTKSALNQLCKGFVDYVLNQNSDTNIGLIYYCGHGLSNLTGKMYWVPSNLTANIDDTSFDFLNENLFSVDSLIKHIVTGQLTCKNNTKFYIIADCCSDKAPSKWYRGITYKLWNYKSNLPGNTIEIGINYNLDSLNKQGGLTNSLQASAALQLDSIPGFKKDSMKLDGPGLGEIPDIGAIIRQRTFNQFDNRLYYSSAAGEETTTVFPPGKKEGYKVGPLCRRTLLIIKNAPANLTFNMYFHALQDPEVDKLTQPAQLNIIR